MNKLLLMLPMVLLLASCSETIEDADLSPQRLRSVRDLRVVYDEKYVEWDSVEYFSYKVSEGVVRHDLAVPWASGSTGAIGIPDEWIDMDCLNPDASKRKYSKKNGSVYSFSKYFGVGSAIKRNFYHENVEI